MTMFRAACVQLQTSRDIAANLAVTDTLVREAARHGADYVQTPEQSELMELKADALFGKIGAEADNVTLKALRALAQELSIWLHIGSLAIRVGDRKAANRAFVIAPDATIAARYDKLHMFDVDLPSGESYRESATYQPGDAAVCIDLPWLRLGVTICYDLRFPHLYRTLAQAGARMLSAPAAFTQVTGEAHWHVLQRARAIETGSFVVSAAQGGHHENGRDTYGHSLIVDPWGKVLAEAGQDPCVIVADIDPALADAARGRIPALTHDRDYSLPGARDAGRKAS